MVVDCKRNRKDSCERSKGCLCVRQAVLPSAWKGGDSACNFWRRFPAERVSWRHPENPETKRRNRMCLQALWESGQVQDMDVLETVRM